MVKPSDDLIAKYALYKGKDAQTIEDIVKECGLGSSTVRAHARKMAEQNHWKKVWVKRNNKIMPAYIRVK